MLIEITIYQKDGEKNILINSSEIAEFEPIEDRVRGPIVRMILKNGSVLPIKQTMDELRKALGLGSKTDEERLVQS